MSHGHEPVPPLLLWAQLRLLERLGLAPGDQEVNTRLHQRLAPLIEQDLALYLQSLRSEWVAHAARLKAAGWRKAQAT